MSDNPLKRFVATVIDKWSSPIITDTFMPDTRKGCEHYENRIRYFITKSGSHGGIDKNNYKSHFGKDFKEKHEYDRRTNTEMGPSLSTGQSSFKN